MNLCAVVILYYPNEEELFINLDSYCHYVDCLFVIDNTPGSSAIKEKLIQRHSNIIYIKNETNIGVAAALNIGVNLASEEKCNWLLTMDQDSSFKENEIKRYLHYFEKDFYDREDVAVISPEHESNHGNGSVNKVEYLEVMSTITSGSLVNIKICKSVGGFEERLFIDDVDHEYCYRCISQGFKILKYSGIYLTHNLGKKKHVGYFFLIKKTNRTIHSPFRVYFMVRNHFYVSSKYKKLFPGEIKQKRKQLFVHLKNNLLFSGQFFKVLFAALKGYLHYKLNKYS
jgi:rhamnosyltransferase